MKRKGYLYERIIDMDNLLLAQKRSQKGKKWQRGVIKHNKNKEQELLYLHKLLVGKEYKTSPYSTFTKWDKKERKIFSLPYFPERVVQHAIIQIIGPIFIKSFISQTYSCIPKKGIHLCLKDINNALKQVEETTYCLKIDIKKFYPSINNGILKDLLRDKFKDKDLLNLLDEIVDSHKIGIPIGSYISQFFGNFYLNKFDHWIKEVKRIKYFFRYTDDICILHNDKNFLHNLREEIQQYLSMFDLELSNYQIFPISSRGIDYVGYKSFHTHVLLRKSIKQKFKTMIRKNRNEKSITSYFGWIKHCDGKNLFNKYVNYVNEN